MKILLVVVMMVVGVGEVSAADYYVKQGGVDTGSCPVGSPCGTFAFALPKAVAGDTVHLDCTGGVFTQPMKPGVAFSVNNGTGDSDEERVIVKAKVGCVRGVDGTVAEIRPVADGAVSLSNVRYWTLRDFVVDGRNLVGGATTTGGIGIDDGSYGTVNGTKGIKVVNVLVRDISNPTGSNSIGVYLNGDDHVFEDSVVDGTHIVYGDNGGSHCLYGADPGNNLIVRGNEFKNCGGFGVQMNDTADKGAIDGVPHNTGTVITRNRVHDNGQRPAGSRGGITVFHHQVNVSVDVNVVYDNIGPGVDVGGNGTQNVTVRHNSIVDNGSGCITAGADASHTAHFMVFRNNICESNGAGAQFKDFTDNSVITHNVFHDASAMVNLGSGSTVSDNITSDPLLVSLAGNDFHLQAASPARGVGVTGLGITSDIDSTLYPTPPDMGCYSFGGVAALPTFVLRRMMRY